MWEKGNIYIKPNQFILSMIFNGVRWRKSVPIHDLDILYTTLDSDNVKDMHLSESLKPMQRRKLHMCFNKNSVNLEELKYLVRDIKKCYDILFTNQSWEISYDVGIMENEYWYQIVFHVIDCNNVYEMESLIEDICDISTETSQTLIQNRISFEIDISVDWALKNQYGMNLIQGCSSSEDWFIGIYDT